MIRIFLVLLVLFLSGCGFTPMYSSKNTNYKIISFEENIDNNLTNYIQNSINVLSNENADKSFKIDLKFNEEISIILKDSKGDPKKNRLIISIDLKGLTSITDHFLICSADTDVQIKAIADNIRKNTYTKPVRIEGYEKMNWVILDYIDVVVHIFKNIEREYYNLEKLWGDAKTTTYSDDDS